MTFPWETPQLPAVPLADTVAAMQRDMTYMVTHTAVLVRSTHPELKKTVNTPRGQIIPRGVCKFNNAYGSDPHTTEFQDLGMPRPGVPEMTMGELMAYVWDTAHALGLDLE